MRALKRFVIIVLLGMMLVPALPDPEALFESDSSVEEADDLEGTSNEAAP